MRLSCVLAVAVAVGACGDNSKVCGQGTQDLDGVCVGMGDGNDCGPGTVEVDGTCVPEAEACATGETAVEGNCVQIDLQEGAEPNGGEVGANPAGVLMVPAAGDRFTANGCINNHPAASNDDPDFDRYLLTITGPVLVKLTVDGRGGMIGGFRATGDAGDAELVGYERYGLGVASDLSRRQVYLPKAGTYPIVVSDSRTLMEIIDGDPPAPAGDPDGTTSCYLLHVEAQAIPAPTPLVAGTPATGTIGEDLAFFTGTFADGFNSVTATIEPSGEIHASASLVVMNDDELRQFSVASTAGNVLFAGIDDTDTPLLVLDYAYNYALEPAAYEVSVDFMIDSIPLARDGTPTAATPSKGQFFIADDGDLVFENINLFHWEVTEPNTTDGFDITFSRQMAGVIVDQNGLFVAPFAESNGEALAGTPASSVTFNTYRGLIRSDTPGTYYFFLYAPRNAVGTPIIATSTITTLAETPIVLGTATDPQAPNAFNSNPFHYDAGSETPWQLLNATGTGTGALRVGFFAPSTPGRFDDLAVRAGSGAGAPRTVAPNVVPVLAQTFAANGTTPIGHIFKNPRSATLPAETSFFVQVRPTRASGASRSFQLDFQPRAYHDFGMLAPGATAMVADQPLTSAMPERRFYFEAPPNSTVTVTVQPTTITMNPALVFLETDEAEHRVVDDGLVDEAETFTYTQDASGYTAVVVRAGLVTTDQAFTITVAIDPPAYTATSGSTPYADVCATGTVHPSDDPFSDDGLTDPIPTVAGFDFFGAPAATELVVSTNGFLSFDPDIVDPAYTPAPLPDEVGEASVAPLWSDLWQVEICSKIEGTKQIIQWAGEDLNTGQLVELQAILDASDDSIELVYGAATRATGATATAGIQDLGGLLGFGTGVFDNFVMPGSSVKLTPTP